MKNKWAGGLLSWLVAIAWTYAGVQKLIEFVSQSRGSEAGTWASGFPVWIILTVAIIECLAGMIVFTGYRLVGLAIGSLLLSAFLIAQWIYPPLPEQPCGCFGSASVASQVGLQEKIIFFAGLHLLAAACVWKLPRVSNSGEPSRARNEQNEL